MWWGWGGKVTKAAKAWIKEAGRMKVGVGGTTQHPRSLLLMRLLLLLLLKTTRFKVVVI